MAGVKRLDTDRGFGSWGHLGPIEESGHVPPKYGVAG